MYDLYNVVYDHFSPRASETLIREGVDAIRACDASSYVGAQDWPKRKGTKLRMIIVW